MNAAGWGAIIQGAEKAIDQKNYRRNTEDIRYFQERMSSTAYSRAVNDLRSAGLNPILAAGGSGMSTPGAASAPFQSGPGIGSSALSWKLGQEQIKLLKEQQLNTFEDSRKKEAERENIQSSTGVKNLEMQLMQNMLPESNAMAKIWDSGGAGLGGLQKVLELLKLWRGSSARQYERRH